MHPEALPPPAPSAAPKGKKAEPLPPAAPLDPTAFHWTGEKHVYFVQLHMSPDTIKSRYRSFPLGKHIILTGILSTALGLLAFQLGALQSALSSTALAAKSQAKVGVRRPTGHFRTGWVSPAMRCSPMAFLCKGQAPQRLLCWAYRSKCSIPQVLLPVAVCTLDKWKQTTTTYGSYLLSCRAGVAQAAADEAAMLAPPSPPPEPATNALAPPRGRRTGAAAPKPPKPSPKKVAAASSPRRSKSKPVASGSTSDTKQQKLVLPDADPSPLEPGVSDPGVPAADVDDTPAELSTAIAVWQQFDEEAKGLLVGRAQADNMVQLLTSQVENKQPEQVIMEVDLWPRLHRCVSRDNDTCCIFRRFQHIARYSFMQQCI